jgi:hypothetical protein
MSRLDAATYEALPHALPHALNRIGMKGQHRMFWARGRDTNCQKIIGSLNSGNALPRRI